MYFRNSDLEENLQKGTISSEGHDWHKQDFNINDHYCAGMEAGRQNCRKRGLIMIFCANISRCVCVPAESRRAVNVERCDMQSDSLLSVTLQLRA